MSSTTQFGSEALLGQYKAKAYGAIVLNHHLTRSRSLDALPVNTTFKLKSFSAVSAILTSIPFVVSGMLLCPLSIHVFPGMRSLAVSPK